MDGIAVIDKPEGWTSHDVVAKLRGLAKTKRVGHLGTLDPMATGVLPLAIGAATRLVRFYAGTEKLYQAGVLLGYSTDTYDRTGARTSEPAPVNFEDAQVEHALADFRGRILQRPPIYSAKKVRGIIAHRAAREGISLQLEPVEVVIRELTLVCRNGPLLELRVRCSAGTYIRSLAHDLGQKLGCGAHLDSLRRLAAGEFTIDQATPVGTIDLIPLRDLLPQFPALSVDERTGIAVRQGRNISAPQMSAVHLRVFDSGGTLIAVCNRTEAGDYHPSVVLG